MRTFEGEVLRLAMELKEFTTKEITDLLKSKYDQPRTLIRERVKNALKVALRSGLVEKAGMHRNVRVWRWKG